MSDLKAKRAQIIIDLGQPLPLANLEFRKLECLYIQSLNFKELSAYLKKQCLIMHPMLAEVGSPTEQRAFVWFVIHFLSMLSTHAVAIDWTKWAENVPAMPTEDFGSVASDVKKPDPAKKEPDPIKVMARALSKPIKISAAAELIVGKLGAKWERWASADANAARLRGFVAQVEGGALPFVVTIAKGDLVTVAAAK